VEPGCGTASAARYRGRCAAASLKMRREAYPAEKLRQGLGKVARDRHFNLGGKISAGTHGLPFSLPRAEILQTCAEKPCRGAEHMEKDVWICWVLHALFTMPGRLPMAFKSGTSLSKVYGAIQRFSENVTVDYKSLDRSIDAFDVKTSRTAREKFTELLRTKLANHTKNVIRPHSKLLSPSAPKSHPSPLPSPRTARNYSFRIPRASGQTKAFSSNLEGAMSSNPARNTPLNRTLPLTSRTCAFPKPRFVCSPHRGLFRRSLR
jgi:Nucleotidyl transferase AbiEii toxin, Type IV TA system